MATVALPTCDAHKKMPMIVYRVSMPCLSQPPILLYDYPLLLTYWSTTVNYWLFDVAVGNPQVC